MSFRMAGVAYGDTTMTDSALILDALGAARTSRPSTANDSIVHGLGALPLDSLKAGFAQRFSRRARGGGRTLTSFDGGT